MTNPTFPVFPSVPKTPPLFRVLSFFFCAFQETKKKKKVKNLLPSYLTRRLLRWILLLHAIFHAVFFCHGLVYYLQVCQSEKKIVDHRKRYSSLRRKSLRSFLCCSLVQFEMITLMFSRLVFTASYIWLRIGDFSKTPRLGKELKIDQAEHNSYFVSDSGLDFPPLKHSLWAPLNLLTW